MNHVSLIEGFDPFKFGEESSLPADLEQPGPGAPKSGGASGAAEQAERLRIGNHDWRTAAGIHSTDRP